MARPSRKISLDQLAADLEAVFDRVAREGEAVVVEKGGRELAILKPAGPGRPRRARKGRGGPGAEEVARAREAILKAAGSWEGLDVDAFKAYLRERRRASSRPPVRL